MTDYYMHVYNLNIRLANFLHMILVMQLLLYYFKCCMIAVLAIAVVCREISPACMVLQSLGETVSKSISLL